MSRWFRHYAGLCRDDKLVRAALRSKQSIERVVWIYGAVLESAAEMDDAGRYEVDAAEIAHFLRCRPTAVQAVLDALTDLGRINGTHVTAWSKRQFKSDRSNDRVAASRERKRSRSSGDVTLPDDASVTLPERDGNSPETETETEVPLANANGANRLFPDEPKSDAADADAAFWATAKSYLAKAGVKNPGGVVGGWVRDHGKVQTADALTRAQLERAVEPVPFVQGCFRQGRKAAEAVGPLC